MIKINLALKKQPAGGGGAGGGYDGPSEKTGLNKFTSQIDTESLKQLPLLKIGLSVGIAFAANWIAADEKDSRLKEYDAKIQTLELKKAELQKEKASLAGVKQIEEELEKNRLSVQTKIDAVDRLMKNRDAIFRTAQAVAQISPPDLWLSSLEIEGPKVTIKAKAPADSLVISEFYRQITESALFEGGQSTQQGEVQNSVDKTGMKVSSFEITAKRRLE